MSDAEMFFKDLTVQIESVKPGKMFGALCMKTPNGKSAAMIWRDHLVVKLNENSLNEALNLSEMPKMRIKQLINRGSLD